MTIDPTGKRVYAPVPLAWRDANWYEVCTGDPAIGPGCGRRLHYRDLEMLSDGTFMCDNCVRVAAKAERKRERCLPEDERQALAATRLVEEAEWLAAR